MSSAIRTKQQPTRSAGVDHEEEEVQRIQHKQKQQIKNHRVWLIPEPSVLAHNHHHHLQLQPQPQQQQQLLPQHQAHHQSLLSINHTTTSSSSSSSSSVKTELNVEIQLNDFDATSDKLIRDIKQAIHYTLRYCGLERKRISNNATNDHSMIDLLMVQLPAQVYDHVDRLIAVWSDLEKLVKMEIVKHVGLCYVDEEQLEQLLSSVVDHSKKVKMLPYAIQLNYWEYSPLIGNTNAKSKNRNKWNSMNSLCNQYGIKVLASSDNSVSAAAGKDQALLKNSSSLVPTTHNNSVEQQRWFVHYTVQLPETSLIQSSGYIISDQTY